MEDLTALICKCCGGQIDRTTLTCKSCGTQYKQNRAGVLEIISAPRPFKFIEGAVIIPKFIVKDNPEEVMEHSVHKIAVQLAEKMLPLVEWVEEYDPYHQDYVLHARVGVIEPRDNTKPNLFLE